MISSVAQPNLSSQSFHFNFSGEHSSPSIQFYDAAQSSPTFTNDYNIQHDVRLTTIKPAENPVFNSELMYQTSNESQETAYDSFADNAAMVHPSGGNARENKKAESSSRGGPVSSVGHVMLGGVPIVSLTIDGQERLCLAQISGTLLKEYSYNEIHNRRVALGITCVQCTPVQLELLRRAGAMPVTSRRCGMITRREAERLIRSFLDDTGPPQLPEDFSFEVVHNCGWGCRGTFIPSRYNSSRAKCIKCYYCDLFFSPNKFIFHFHRTQNSKYYHPDAANFNSWRRHLNVLVCPDHGQTEEGSRPEQVDVLHAWEDVKAMFNGGNRRRNIHQTRNCERTTKEVQRTKIMKPDKLNLTEANNKYSYDVDILNMNKRESEVDNSHIQESGAEKRAGFNFNACKTNFCSAIRNEYLDLKSNLYAQTNSSPEPKHSVDQIRNFQQSIESEDKMLRTENSQFYPNFKISGNLKNCNLQKPRRVKNEHRCIAMKSNTFKKSAKICLYPDGFHRIPNFLTTPNMQMNYKLYTGTCNPKFAVPDVNTMSSAGCVGRCYIASQNLHTSEMQKKSKCVTDSEDYSTNCSVSQSRKTKLFRPFDIEPCSKTNPVSSSIVENNSAVLINTTASYDFAPQQYTSNICHDQLKPHCNTIQPSRPIPLPMQQNYTCLPQISDVNTIYPEFYLNHSAKDQDYTLINIRKNTGQQNLNSDSAEIRNIEDESERLSSCSNSEYAEFIQTKMNEEFSESDQSIVDIEEENTPDD